MGSDHPVKRARLEKGWRLVDLASRVGRSAPLISMVENGYVPKRGTCELIARALGKRVEDLWDQEEE